LASVGKATAFSCTVVSTMTLEKSEGFATPVLVATRGLSCTTAASYSPPMRWRQRVSDAGARRGFVMRVKLLERPIGDARAVGDPTPGQTYSSCYRTN
jgi:hypothetical protein